MTKKTNKPIITRKRIKRPTLTIGGKKVKIKPAKVNYDSEIEQGKELPEGFGKLIVDPQGYNCQCIIKKETEEDAITDITKMTFAETKEDLFVGEEKKLPENFGKLNFPEPSKFLRECIGNTIIMNTPIYIIKIMDDIRDILNVNFPRLGINVTFDNQNGCIDIMCLMNCQGIMSYIVVSIFLCEINVEKILECKEELTKIVKRKIEFTLGCFVRDTISALGNKKNSNKNT